MNQICKEVIHCQRFESIVAPFFCAAKAKFDMLAINNFFTNLFF